MYVSLCVCLQLAAGRENEDAASGSTVSRGRGVRRKTSSSSERQVLGGAETEEVWWILYISMHVLMADVVIVMLE